MSEIIKSLENSINEKNYSKFKKILGDVCKDLNLNKIAKCSEEAKLDSSIVGGRLTSTGINLYPIGVLSLNIGKTCEHYFKNFQGLISKVEYVNNNLRKVELFGYGNIWNGDSVHVYDCFPCNVNKTLLLNYPFLKRIDIEEIKRVYRK